jgi:hypothetical protein
MSGVTEGMHQDTRILIQPPKIFQKTVKQREACDVLNRHDHALLVGGSRSTKTTIAVKNIVARAIKRPSRHLIVRFRFNHAKASIWYDTLPKVFQKFYPQVRYKENKQDWFIQVPCCKDFPGEYSTIWLGGIDDKDRVEKILGNEYSTILANECSQISYDAITMLRTRLAEASGLKLRFYYDLNPCGIKHWTNQELIKGFIPGTKEKSKLNCGHIFMNPLDNPYLPKEYIDALKALPKRKRQRFLDGRYITDVEGALWTDQMMSEARCKSYGKIIKTVVAVDPSTTDNPGSDECGIVVCSLDENREGVVEADYTIKASPATWAARAVNAYYTHEANEIVAEVNQGGDLVKNALKNIDPSIKVKTVRASKSKRARAEPISELYELGKIAHAKDMPEFESELTEWVPMNTTESPNRVDSVVWGFYRLMLKPSARFHIG